MKKIGKKLSYFMKLFLAFALLFSNVSSFGVVLAEGLTDEGDNTGKVTKVDGENKEEPNENGSGEETPIVDETNSEDDTTNDDGEIPTTGETGTNDTPTTGTDEVTTGGDTPTQGEEN